MGDKSRQDLVARARRFSAGRPAGTRPSSSSTLKSLTSRVSDEAAFAAVPEPAKAVTLLREKGFDRAVKVTGGILAWVDRIEPHKSKY